MKERQWHFSIRDSWIFYGNSKKLAIKDACEMLSQMIEECKKNNYSVNSEFVEQFDSIVKGDKVETGAWTKKQLREINNTKPVEIRYDKEVDSQ